MADKGQPGARKEQQIRLFLNPNKERSSDKQLKEGGIASDQLLKQLLTE